MYLFSTKQILTAYTLTILVSFLFLFLPSTSSAAIAPLQGGVVSLTFDDGWLSAYENAVPLLNAKNFKATFYIYTDAMKGASQPQDTWEGYMNTSQVVGLFNSGHEIGAHSRAHADLTLASTNLAGEINGSKQDLLNVGVGWVKTFAYPYGAYNAKVINQLKQRGFIGARSTDDDIGYNTANTDPFVLQIQHVTNTTSVNTIKNWIDQARSSNRWLVLMFHEVVGSPSQCMGGDEECTTTSVVSNTVNYLSSKNACVKTVAAVLSGQGCSTTPPPGIDLPPTTPPPTTPPPTNPPPVIDPPTTPPPPPIDENPRPSRNPSPRGIDTRGR